MKNSDKLYCTECKKLTKHTPKLSAIMAGYMVCGKCSKMNGFCSLIKIGQDNFEKHSKNIRWVEFDETARGKALHDNISIGYSLMMSPFNDSFTWMTTPVTEIIEARDNYIHFKTENSEYVLHYNPEIYNKFV